MAGMQCFNEPCDMLEKTQAFGWPHRLWVRARRRGRGRSPFMSDEPQKILTYIGRVMHQNSGVLTAIGFLLADPDRVRFVLRGAETQELGMMVSIHRRIEIPGPLWQGWIRGVPVPDPLAWISAAIPLRGHPVVLRVSTDDVLLLQLLQPLVEAEEHAGVRTQINARMREVRDELDRALDLYNEVRHLMEVDRDRQPELEQFLLMAQKQMQGMGHELQTLKDNLHRASGTSWNEGSD